MPQTASRPEPAAVLTRATLRAAACLELSGKELARVLGVSAASLSRLSRARAIDPRTKEGELAVLLLRVFRSLDALVGGDEEAARRWFHADNQHLGGTPAKLVERVEGLVGVAEYLDALRGRL
jgi:hypothetical protein